MMPAPADKVFAALADPTRRQLLTVLAEGRPRTATQLTSAFPRRITRQGIAKHLELLAEAGLVSAETVGRERQYILTPAPLNEIEAWVQAVGARWDARLSRLKQLVEEANE